MTRLRTRKAPATWIRAQKAASLIDEQSVQDGVERQHNAHSGSKSIAAHSTSETQATPAQIDLSNTKLARSKERAQDNDQALESAGETDDDEL